MGKVKVLVVEGEGSAGVAAALGLLAELGAPVVAPSEPPISDPAATDEYLAELAREAAEDPESAEADQKGTSPLDP